MTGTVPLTPLAPVAVRHIQDPIHGSISLSEHESKVVDHPLFQRLKLIKQLGNAHHLFPSATHSRFAHSLGVMHQAGLLFDAIFSNAYEQLMGSAAWSAVADLRRLVRLAGLLHDLGHGPFSHHFEGFLRATGTTYKNWSSTELKIPLQWLHAPHLKSFQESPLCHEHFSFGAAHNLGLPEGDVQAICCLLDSRFKPGSSLLKHLKQIDATWRSEKAAEPGWNSLLHCLRGLLSSDIDADRMDYLRRDAHFCGISVSLDTDHLLRSMKLRRFQGRFVIQLKRNAVFTIEQLLLARKQMFDQVYQNRVTQLVDELLSRSLDEMHRLTALSVPSTIREFSQLHDLSLQMTLQRLVADAHVGHQKELQGDLAIKMFQTRTLPVTLETRFTEEHLADRTQRDLRRAYPTAEVICKTQKEFFKSGRRDEGSQESDVLFSDWGERRGDDTTSLQPVRRLSELIRSSAWRTPHTRILVTKSLHESAVQRGLAQKLEALGLPKRSRGSRGSANGRRSSTDTKKRSTPKRRTKGGS